MSILVWYNIFTFWCVNNYANDVSVKAFIYQPFDLYKIFLQGNNLTNWLGLGVSILQGFFCDPGKRCEVLPYADCARSEQPCRPRAKCVPATGILTLSCLLRQFNPKSGKSVIWIQNPLIRSNVSTRFKWYLGQEPLLLFHLFNYIKWEKSRLELNKLRYYR